MANPQKSKKIYDNLVKTLEDLSKGYYVENLEQKITNTSQIFLHGFKPQEIPESDFSSKIINNLVAYHQLLSSRKKIEIQGGIREVTNETEALYSLFLAESLAKDLIVPFFKKTDKFSNTIFNDIHNLSLSYVDSIVNSIAEEYVPSNQSWPSKCVAIEIAKSGITLSDIYKSQNEIRDEEIEPAMKEFTTLLKCAEEKYMRSFEIVPTNQKRIYKGKELMKILQEQTTKQEKGEFLFKPEIIFPIAHGGTETGIRIALAYEEKGYSPTVYPLLYSMKTRKHRSPKTDNDESFLTGSLDKKNLLITEDWVTTGNTLTGVINKLSVHKPQEIRVATLKRDKDRSMNLFLEKYDFYIGNLAKYAGGKSKPNNE